MKRDCQHVAPLGSFDVDGPRQGMNRVEIQRCESLDTGLHRELSIGRLLRVDFYHRAGGHTENRRNSAAEAIVGLL